MRSCSAGALLALFLPGVASAGVVINELFPNPAGVDTGYEWVELSNTGPAAVDITGWELEAGFSSYSSKHTFGAVILAPGDRLWVGEALVVGVDVVTGTLALPNASASGDAVRLVDAFGVPVDTVIYGPNNADAFLDDSGAVAVSFGPTPGDDDALARLPDGADTDQSGADFALVGVPTPDASNDPAIPPDTGDTGDGDVGACSAGGAVINEILSDAPGAEGAGLEWIELYNPGVSEVDVSGWTIASGTSSYATEGVIPAGTVVPAGGHLVVGQTPIAGVVDVVAFGFELGNAGSSSDAVRILDCAGAVVDTVVYGDPNTDLWVDDSGLVAVSLAPAPSDPESIGRATDGVDTDRCGDDFVEIVAPTPGASNGAGPAPPGSCDDAAAGTAVVINELLPDPDDTDEGNEWVELHNAGGTSVDVSGWVVAAGTSSFSGTGTLPAGTVLAPGAFLVVGQAAIAEVDVVAPGWSLGNAGTSADGVRIEDCDGAVVDTVIYGSPGDGWTDDTGGPATSLAPKPGGGESVARVADGVDTDASAVDFAVEPFPTPGAGNDAPVPDCGAVGSGVKINELLYDPDSSDTGLEWVELFHAGAATVDLSGWALEKATSSFGPAFVFPDGATIAPGEIVLIGEDLVASTDFVATLGMGNASSSADGVRLVDCSGFPADTVIYGDANTDGLVDDTLSPATSLAPGVGGGSSLQRIEDGYDTDACGVDFAEQELPTPGASNPIVAAVVCVPSGGGVVLNEFVPNPTSTDTSAEWVELYNAGAAAADVSGWGIDTATSAWGDPDAVLPGGTIVPAGGFLVVGGALSPATVIAEFSLGNATSNADGIRLLDCTGAQVDAVIYGESNPDGLLDDAGGIVPSPVPGEAGSLAREPDGLDTDAPTDWVIRGAPSPGESNFFDAGSLGEEEPRGCGCGGRPDEGAPEPGGGCATDPVRGYGASLAVALLLALRRQRRT